MATCSKLLEGDDLSAPTTPMFISSAFLTEELNPNVDTSAPGSLEASHPKKRRRNSSADEGFSLTTDTTPLPSRQSKRKKRPNANRRSNACRKKRREASRAHVFQPLHDLEYRATKPPRSRWGVDVMYTQLNALSLPRASSCFIGRSITSGSCVWTIEGVLSLPGFVYKAWDGLLPIPICDEAERVITVLAGRPTSGGYLECTEQLAEALFSAGLEANLTHVQERQYCSLSAGVGFESGQKEPTNLTNNPTNMEILESIMLDHSTCRVTNFCSNSLGTWAPNLFRYYRERLEFLYESHPHLLRLHPSSIFPASTIDYGSNTVTMDHADQANVPFGWCSVTALGDFDATKGGHIILWDARLVIEFPAGSTILIPSGLMQHSNTTIGNTERRLSFTQYCAGGLFQWVEYGCRAAQEFPNVDSISKDLVDSWQENQRLNGIDLFSTLSALREG